MISVLHAIIFWLDLFSRNNQVHQYFLTEKSTGGLDYSY